MIKLMPVNEVPEESRKVVEVNTRKVLIIRSGGQFFAVDNQCPHMRLPLANGKLTEDHVIVCPFHHSAFDLASGDVKEWTPWPPLMGKALGAIAREKALPVFRTEVIDGVLWIEPEPA